MKTYGCSANTADSEVLAGCLKAAGFQLVASEAEAQLLIFNSCAVKGPTENRIIDDLKKTPKTKKVIIAGCLPLISFERLMREVHFDAAVGPAAGSEIVEVAEKVMRGEKVSLPHATATLPSLSLPRVQTSPVISVVPVSYGCLGSCAFCCVVHARGHLRSYSVSDVVARMRGDLSFGTKEFWITSQDTACYGRNLGTNLAGLLTAVSAIEGDFRVRVGMMTPNLIASFLEDLTESFRSEKVFKFVHLPVQSGDDEVLRRMRRFYTSVQFKKTVAAFRKAFPEITVSTDVICGFPGETKEAFSNTLALLDEVQPDIVNVSKFFARPKTAAWEMRNEAVDKGEIKRRSSEAAKLAKQISLSRNERWVGWTGEILVDEKGKLEGTWVGRNFAYKPMTVKSGKNLLGKTVNVRVNRAFVTHLTGEIT